MDLIDRQAALDEFPDDHLVWDTFEGYVAPHFVRKIIKALPSVQPEIIRCEDCKYYREYGYVNGKPKFLPRCTFNSIYVNADDFCSKAERRGKAK